MRARTGLSVATGLLAAATLLAGPRAPRSPLRPRSSPRAARPGRRRAGVDRRRFPGGYVMPPFGQNVHVR